MGCRLIAPPRSRVGSAPVGGGEASHTVGVPQDEPGRGGAPQDEPGCSDTPQDLLGRKQKGCEINVQDKSSNIFMKHYLHLFYVATVFFPIGSRVDRRHWRCHTSRRRASRRRALRWRTWRWRASMCCTSKRRALWLHRGPTPQGAVRRDSALEVRNL